MRPRNRRRWAGKDCRKAEIITKWTGSSSKITEERFTAEQKFHSFTSSLWISLKILQAQQLLQYELLHFRRTRFCSYLEIETIGSGNQPYRERINGSKLVCKFGAPTLPKFADRISSSPADTKTAWEKLDAPKLREGMKTFRPRGPNFRGWRSWQEKAGSLVEKWQLFALREFHFPCSSCRNGRRKEADRRSR